MEIKYGGLWREIMVSKFTFHAVADPRAGGGEIPPNPNKI